MTKSKPKVDKLDLVKQRCVLVSFAAGYYNWVRRDRKAERDYSASVGVNKDTYKTHKNLFVGTDALLASAKGLVNESRAFHYDFTLPWQHGHSAALANGLVPMYREKISGFQIRMDQINDQIRSEWPNMLRDAKSILGVTYDAKQYPPVDKVIASNYVRTQFSPVGTGDDIRSTLKATDPAMDDIANEINADTRAAYDAAIKALWERMFDVLKVASTNLQKLNSDDGRFRTEWYDNLQSLLPALEHLNLGDDPRIDQIKADAEKLLRYDIDELKQDVDSRAELAEEADEVFNRVAGIFATFEG